jgi:hypothetical protein
MLGSVQFPVQWVLAALSSAVTPNHASVHIDNIVLLMSNARVHSVMNTVIDQETIGCFVISQSWICFLLALLSCPLLKYLEIREVKVAFASHVE